ncbi:MAG: hypothetical protein LBT44_06215 [Clostridiales bacterium]|nr:hypothetical protein [Clostridiales bacterium]
MIKKLSHVLFKDFTWKILALFSAVLLWYVVMTVENPLQKKSIMKMISLQNEDMLQKNGFVLMNRDKITQNVRLNVQAKLSDITKIYNQSPYVNAYIDLKAIDESYNNRLGDPISMAISVDAPAQCQVVSRDPESVTMFIDKLAYQVMPVNVKMNGTAKENFEEQDPLSSQNSVEIVAPRSVLDMVESVEATVYLKNADQDVVARDVELIVYDGDHKDITSKVTLDINTISVTVPVYPIQKTPILPKFEGNPQAGYWVSGVTPVPNAVEIVGRPEALEQVQAVDLPPVNLTNINADKEQIFDIRDYLQGDSVSLRKGAGYEVKVTVRVEKEAVRSLSTPMQNVNVIRDANHLSVELPPGPITFSVRGPAAAVNRINEDSVKADLDLSGLPEGVHVVALRFHLPANVVVSGGPVRVQVVITDELSTATILPPEESPAAEESLAEDIRSDDIPPVSPPAQPSDTADNLSSPGAGLASETEETADVSSSPNAGPESEGTAGSSSSSTAGLEPGSETT